MQYLLTSGAKRRRRPVLHLNSEAYWFFVDPFDSVLFFVDPFDSVLFFCSVLKMLNRNFVTKVSIMYQKIHSDPFFTVKKFT